MSELGRDRAEEWFHRLVPLRASERTRLLTEITTEDPALAREIESLLTAHDTEGTFDRLTARFAPEPLIDGFPFGEASEELVDRVLGHYRVLELVGRGGRGDVYRARDERLGRDLALKFLPPWLNRDPSARDRFLVEARIVSAIDHPNVCSLLEMGETEGGRFFLIMPFYEGETLDRRLVRGPLPVAEAIDVARQAARGLAAAHERGIVHRDIKPSNLLLTEDGTVKILDFGVAKLAGVSLTREGETPGTYRYMAPEQASGAAVDHRADLWSLGVMLFEMLTGRRPFAGDRPPAPDGGLEKGAFDALSEAPIEAPEPLRKILGHLLATRPDDRYAEAGMVASDLTDLCRPQEGARLRSNGSARRPRGDAPLPAAKSRGVPLRIAAILTVCVLALALLMVPGSWLGFRGAGQRPGSGPGGISRSVIATMPFTVRGSEEVAYLGEGMVNLFGTKLDGAGDLRSVDSRALLSRIASTTSGALDPHDAASVARTFGAGLFVQGEVMQAGDRLRIDATLYDSDTAQPITEASAEGAVEDVFRMVDEITTRLLGSVGSGPGTRVQRIAALTTSSLPALKAYLTGEQASRAGEYQRAVESFQRAVAEDSLFALAHYRLAAVAAYTYSAPGIEPAAAETALRHSDRLSERDRALLEAFVAQFRDRETDEAERRYRSLLGRWPDDVQAWFDLGEILFHRNPLYGRPPSEARVPFSRVLAFEPDNTSAMLHLIRLAAHERRLAEMDSLANRYLAIAGEGERALEVTAIQAFAHDDPAWEAEVIEELRSATNPTIDATMLSLASFLGDLDGMQRIARIRADPRRSPEMRGLGHLWLGYIHLARGERSAAEEEIARARGLSPPAFATYYRALPRLLPWLPLTEGELEALLDQTRALPEEPVEGAVESGPTHGKVEPHVRAFLIGILHARQGHPFERATGQLEALGGTTGAPTLGFNLARQIEGYDAWLRGDAARALDRFEAMRGLGANGALLMYSHLYTNGLARYLRARALETAGRREEAEGWYESFPYNAFEVVFLAPSHFHRGEIRERAGDRDAAVAHYRKFLELWKNPDPELEPMIGAARAALRRLGA